MGYTVRPYGMAREGYALMVIGDPLKEFHCTEKGNSSMRITTSQFFPTNDSSAVYCQQLRIYTVHSVSFNCLYEKAQFMINLIAKFWGK